MTNIEINTAFDISDTDFLEPKNSYLLPPLPEKIRTLIHIEKKQILLKEAIFEKMHKTHQELSCFTSKEVLHKSLYEQTIIMLTKPKKKPYYWVLAKSEDYYSITVIDTDPKKKYVEIVGWRKINERGFLKMKKQVIREDGHILITDDTSVYNRAADLSALPNDPTQ